MSEMSVKANPHGMRAALAAHTLPFLLCLGCVPTSNEELQFQMFDANVNDEYAKAERLATTLLRRANDSDWKKRAAANMILGYSRAELGDYRGAIEAYERALESYEEKDRVYAHYRLGMLRLKKRTGVYDRDKAKAHFHRALETRRDHDLATADQGGTAARKGGPRKAMEEARRRKARRLKPYHDLAMIGLAAIAVEEGDHEEARRLIAQFEGLRQHSARAAEALAWYYSLAQDRKNALRWTARAVVLDPEMRDHFRDEARAGMDFGWLAGDTEFRLILDEGSAPQRIEAIGRPPEPQTSAERDLLSPDWKVRLAGAIRFMPPDGPGYTVEITLDPDTGEPNRTHSYDPKYQMLHPKNRPGLQALIAYLKIGDKTSLDDMDTDSKRLFKHPVAYFAKRGCYFSALALEEILAAGDRPPGELLPLLSRMVEEGGWKTRRKVAHFARALPRDVAVLVISKVLTTSAQGLDVAVQVAGGLLDPRLVPALVESIRLHDHDASEGPHIVLGKIGDRTAVEPLIQILTAEDTHEYGRACALLALGRLQAPEGLPHALEMIRRYENSEKYWASGVVGAACVYLGSVKAREGLDALLRIAETSRRAREHAIWALGRIGDLRAVPHLIASLDCDWAPARYCAAEALGRMGVKAAIPNLRRRLSDKRWEVRFIVGRSLLALGDPMGVETVLKGYVTGSANSFPDGTGIRPPEMAAEAFNAFAGTDFPAREPSSGAETWESWKRSSTRLHTRVRRWWRANRDRFPEPRDIPSLAELMRSYAERLISGLDVKRVVEERDSRAILRQLGQLAGLQEHVLEPLSRLSEGPTLQHRLAAAIILSKIESRKRDVILLPLVNSLARSEGDVLDVLMEVTAEMGGTAHVPALVGLLPAANKSGKLEDLLHHLSRSTGVMFAALPTRQYRRRLHEDKVAGIQKAYRDLLEAGVPPSEKPRRRPDRAEREVEEHAYKTSFVDCPWVHVYHPSHPATVAVLFDLEAMFKEGGAELRPPVKKLLNENEFLKEACTPRSMYIVEWLVLTPRGKALHRDFGGETKSRLEALGFKRPVPQLPDLPPLSEHAIQIFRGRQYLVVRMGIE